MLSLPTLTPSSRLACLLGLSFACACHGSATPVDAHADADAGLPSLDGGPPPDGSAADTSAVLADADVPPDADVLPDAGGPPDAGSMVEPLFSDDFESGDTDHTENGFRWRGAPPVTSDHGHSGDHAVRFRYGPDASGEDSSVELRFELGPEGTTDIDRVWIEFMLRVPDNFYHRDDVSSDNNKLFSIWAEYYDNRNGDAEFTYEYIRGAVDGESMPRMSVITDGDPDTYVTRDSYSVRADPLFGREDRGRWVRIGIMASITSDTTREVAQVWKDGVQVMGIVGMSSVTPGGSNWLRKGYVLGWSNSGFAEQTDFYLDDFTVYTTDPGWGG